MGTPATSAEYAERLALYESLIVTAPGIDRKGDTMPYTSMNGNMFSLLTKDGTLALRLPEAERAEFLKKYKTKLVEQYGAVMKEYVSVPHDLLEKTKELSKYFKASVVYASGLKPKPTTRKKPGGAAKPRRKS
jgi:TfoX/Sxy family transcriptional regulator of competence genes